jgi:hypothetical protein
MPGKRVAILQSNYIPWKGYFDLIASVDEFILYDDMQYTRRDWRNRNQIKTPQGRQWLTVPVKVKGKYYQTIRETELDGSDWAQAHWKAFALNYRRAPHFEEIRALFEPFYQRCNHTHLSVLNRELLSDLHLSGNNDPDSQFLGLSVGRGKTERLVALCVQSGASEYVSALRRGLYSGTPVCRTGYPVDLVRLRGYPEYPQLWGKFEQGVTILDLLFNCGKASPHYMRYVQA